MKLSGVLVLTGVLIGMAPPAHAQRAFNGNWSVEVVTEQGACDRAYRFPVIIENGRVRYGGREGIAITGTVNARGTIRSNIVANGLRAQVAGRLTMRDGNGTWTIAGSRNCSGVWSAERRAA